jgi:hypothetical protein
MVQTYEIWLTNWKEKFHIDAILSLNSHCCCDIINLLVPFLSRPTAFDVIILG